MILEGMIPPEKEAGIQFKTKISFDLNDRIKKLEDYIILSRAAYMISNYLGTCSHDNVNNPKNCLVDCECDWEHCPELEGFKQQAREELVKEGVI